MVHTMVERATTDMLIGPDWAMNIEICDMCNRDPAQTKMVVKGVKKRLRRKNVKVQLLSLTLLETMVKNCGDIVHMHIAEKNVLHEMVKIIKKKPDLHVKEKILTLIDTWQEAFGGPRARYPQYYTAYQELLRLGAVFPQRSEKSAPVFTPPQTQPLSSYPQNLRQFGNSQDDAQSSVEPELPTLSSTEIQNAREIMDVLAEMLNAVEPGNKEELRQDVISDLVEKCRTYKRRVVHLVNSTSDESLLCQGLALNDDLQRELAKYEAIASGTIVSIPKEEQKSTRTESLVDVDSPLIDTGNQNDKSLISNASNTNGSFLNQLLLPAPPSEVSAKGNQKIDLLSGDNFGDNFADNFAPPLTETSLALVPSEEPHEASASQQNSHALVPFDMFSDGNIPSNISISQPVHMSGESFPPDSGITSNGIPHYPSPVTSTPPWTTPPDQEPHPVSPVYGAQTDPSLPPPPWDPQPPSIPPQLHTQDSQMMINEQYPGGPVSLPNNHLFQHTSYSDLQPPRLVMPGHMYGMYPQQLYANQMAPYGYNHSNFAQQGGQYLDQRMQGMSLRDDSGLRNSSYQVSTSSHVPMNKPSKPEDKLFGDLVDITKFKQTKSG